MLKNKTLRTFLIVVIVIAVLVGILAAIIFIDNLNNKKISDEITVEEAQTLVDKQLNELPNNVALGSLYVRDQINITVNKIEYGNKKNAILSCSYQTINVGKIIEENINDILDIELINPVTGQTKNATKIQIELEEKMLELLASADKVSGNVVIELYETKDRGWVMYNSDNVINTVFGGILTAYDKIDSIKEIEIDGEKIDVSKKNSLREGCKDCIGLVNYDSQVPDTSSFIQRKWNDFKAEFYNNFIKENRWTYLAKGLGTTLAITALSLILGLVIGFIVAIIRCTNASTGKLKISNAICKIYLTIMRGTPIMIQLLIIYFIILLPLGVPKFLTAVLCFGINSGAYVSEIMRGGIMSIDAGQNEAGRSLGFGYVATMVHVIIPQAFKAILPSLANEFIALLKETSVAFYIGVADLTQGGLKIRSITYSNFMPLLAIALIYLVVVIILTELVKILERRLRKNER